MAGPHPGEDDQRGRGRGASATGLPWFGVPWPGRAFSGGRLSERLLAALDMRRALMAEVDARRLFPWLPVCMGAGVVLFFIADGVPSFWPPFACAAILLGLAVRFRQRLGLFIGLMAFAFVFLGFGAAALKTVLVAAPVLDRPAFARISGFVETVDAGPQGGRMVLTLTSFQSSFSVTAPERLRVTYRGPTPRAGSHITGQARLMPPPQPAFPGGYDFARDAYYLGLGAVGRWSGPISLSAPPRAAGWQIEMWAAVDNARTDMTNRIARVIGGQAGALSAALVTGKRGLIDERANDDLRGAGVYHIVSISGLHMVLAAGVFFWIARLGLVLVPGLANRRPVKKYAAVLAMIGATAYCIFSGSEVATERSLFMTLVMLAAIVFDRPAISMRNLAISAIIVLAREPETMMGPSFQMSYAAVAGMIAGHEWWLRRKRASAEKGGPILPPSWIFKALVVIGASLATTLIASFATAPFAAYHFQRLNPYGLIGNALAIPFVSFIVMPAAVAGTLLMPFGLDAPIWNLMGIGSQKVLEVSSLVAAVDGAVRGLRAFDISALVLMAAGFIWLVLIIHPLRLLGMVPVLLGVHLASHVPPVDILVDRQGQVAMIRGADGKLSTLGRGAGKFTVERWLAADGDMRKAGEASLRTGTTCDRMGCVARLPDGRAVAVVLDATAFEEDCARAHVIITSLAAPPLCQRVPLLIDRARLAHSASLAIRQKGDGFDVVAARAEQHWKPWYGRASAGGTPAIATPVNGIQASPTTLPEPTLRPEPAPADDGAEVLLP
jgi:competence protein ComEC